MAPTEKIACDASTQLTSGQRIADTIAATMAHGASLSYSRFARDLDCTKSDRLISHWIRTVYPAESALSFQQRTPRLHHDYQTVSRAGSPPAEEDYNER